MGGDHHHHDKIKIPKYTVYKVEAIPELVAVKKALAAQGLKDPWLRNEVWKFDLKQRGNAWHITKNTIGRGFLWGLGAAIITTFIEKAWDSKQNHGHGESHH